LFYKKGDKWIVTKVGQEIARVETRKEAALIHYEEVEPAQLEDYKAGKLAHKP
jgi:hypothetical protein